MYMTSLIQFQMNLYDVIIHVQIIEYDVINSINYSLYCIFYNFVGLLVCFILQFTYQHVTLQ